MLRTPSFLAVLALTSLAAPAISAPPAPVVANKAPATVSPETAWRKINWEPNLAAAQARARAEGKPVLLFSLFGKLDEEFC